MSKKILKDGILLLLAKFINIGSGVLVAIFVARYYGVDIYGSYTTAVAFSTFILTFTDLGMDLFMLKECSRNKKMLNEYYGNIILLKLIILVCSALIIVMLSVNLGYSQEVIKIILILLPNVIINYIITTFFVVMQIKGKLDVNAKIQMIQNSLVIMGAILIVLLKLNIYMYSFIQSIVSIIILCIYVKKVDVVFKISFKWSKKIIYGSIFFGLSSLLYIIYYKIDTIMLSTICGAYEVGIYESAYKIVNILISLIIVLDNLIMPKMFELYKINKDRMINIYEVILKYGIIVGIPCSMIIMSISDSIINILYGKEYSDAILILKILIWTISIRLLAAIVGFVITASDNMKMKVKFQIVFAIFNIIMNSILIPKYGVAGAAIATVMTEILVFVVYYIFVKTKFKNRLDIKVVLKCICINIILFLFLLKINEINFVFKGIFSGIVFVVLNMILFRTETIEIGKYIIEFKEKKLK